jgi:hypothetical protein
MSANAQSGDLLTIQDIEARCLESTGEGGGAILNRPNETNIQAGYDFRLNFTVYFPDISSWRDSSFTVIGSLPEGIPFRTTVRRRDIARTDEAHYWFGVDVRVMKLGWARFVLVTGSVDTRPSLDEHSLRDAGKAVELQCPGRQDTGN